MEMGGVGVGARAHGGGWCTHSRVRARRPGRQKYYDATLPWAVSSVECPVSSVRWIVNNV